MADRSTTLVVPHRRQPPETVNSNVIKALKANLLDGSTLDGAVIADVRAINACTTVIATTAGVARFDWTDGRNPNPARSGADGYEVLQLTDALGKLRTFRLGTDQHARRVDMSINVLLGNCASR